MEGDLSKALTYQVKREIAERYFGHRKIIEEDKKALESLAKETANAYEELVGKALLRIYVLLKDKDLIEEFISLSDLPKEPLPFYDYYVVHSESIEKELLKHLQPHGWTSRGRFVNLMLDGYEKLLDDIEAYRERYEECLEEAMVINEEVRLFESRFSLDDILGFLSSLDSRDELVSAFGENIPPGHLEDLAARLKIKGVDIKGLVPAPPSFPPLKRVKGELKSLAQRAFERRSHG